MSHTVITEIERIVEERLGGTVRFVPSARLALILGCEALLRRGDGVAMISPLCEVVAFCTYAAGMKPVFVDSTQESPHIDVALLGELDPTRLGAVMATNLYGIPEALPELREMCKRRNWALIEDAAQVLDSTVNGAQVGTFGDVTILSFKKFFDEDCGVIICRRPQALARVDELVQKYTRQPNRLTRIQARALKMIRKIGIGRLEDMLGALRGKDEDEEPVGGLQTQNTRLTLSHAALSDAIENENVLAGVEPFLMADSPRFRVLPPPAQLERLLAKLKGWDRLSASYRRRGHQVRAALTPHCLDASPGHDPCYLAVPLVTASRDACVQQIWQRERLWTENIYNPPLTDYLPASAFDDARRFPQRDLRWSRDLLPVPVIHAEPYIRSLRSILKDIEPDEREPSTQGMVGVSNEG